MVKGKEGGGKWECGEMKGKKEREKKKYNWGKRKKGRKHRGGKEM